MKPREKRVEEALGLFGKPPREQMESARDSVLRRLQSNTAVLAQQTTSVGNPGSSTRKWWPAVAAVAAVLAMAVLVIWQTAAPAILETVDGSRRIEFDQIIHSNEGAVLKLADGSRVEIRVQSQLSLEHAEDGVRIRLDKGGIIVKATKQRAGHLYVQTKDIIVSVVGTVFLVNAEEEGSRVAVIEGEVRVRQGETEQKLLPGEQVSTSPILQAQPVKQELAWSREAEAHLALLEQSATRAAAAPQLLEFDAVSIRPNVKEPGGGYYFRDNSPNGPQWGFGCHGSDGIPRAPFGTGPDIVLPLGRCVGNGVQLGHLMSYAYGTPWRYGASVPEWARHDASLNGGDAFHIEASAENPASTTTAQLRLMLQAMLADRFKLQTHRETQTVQGYALQVAKNGIKMKPATGDIEQPALTRINDRPAIRGKSSMNDLVLYITNVINSAISIDTPFVDSTGLTGIYEYEFPLSALGGGARGAAPQTAPPPPQTRAERIASRVNDLSSVFEDRLGLQLKPERIPVEVVVIDQVEQPSPN